MTGRARDEEAAWRDLVAQFSMPSPEEDAPSPWPGREDRDDPLAAETPAAETPAGPPAADTPAGPPAGETPAGPPAGETPAGSPAGETPAGPPAAETPAGPPAAESPAGPPAAESPAGSPAGETPGNVDLLPDADPVPGPGPVPELDQVPSLSPMPGVFPAPPQFRIIRPALPPPLPDRDDDERYVPPAPPPLPRLDPASKLAWAALFGGPGYLLAWVIAGWQISSLAGFVAVAAFVGGFATLIMRMGDRPPGDSGPDDGAVV